MQTYEIRFPAPGNESTAQEYGAVTNNTADAVTNPKQTIECSLKIRYKPQLIDRTGKALDEDCRSRYCTDHGIHKNTLFLQEGKTLVLPASERDSHNLSYLCKHFAELTKYVQLV